MVDAETNSAVTAIEPVSPEPTKEDIACAQQFQADQLAIYEHINQQMNEFSKYLTWEELFQFHANDVTRAQAFLEASSKDLETVYE